MQRGGTDLCNSICLPGMVLFSSGKGVRRQRAVQGQYGETEAQSGKKWLQARLWGGGTARSRFTAPGLAPGPIPWTCCWNSAFPPYLLFSS